MYYGWTLWLTSLDSSHDLVRTDAQFLADLREGEVVHLGGPGVPQREEVVREVNCEPWMVPDPLDGDTPHWVHLGEGGSGGKGRGGRVVLLYTRTCRVTLLGS